MNRVSNDIEIINKYHNPVCLTLDISMGREGFVVPDDLPELQELLSQHTDINIVGVMAQLANANDPDLQITASEIDVFSATCEQLVPFIQGAEIHIANSATCLRLPKKSKVFSMVRLGASLYGESTSDNVPMPVSLNYCFSWKTYVSQVRKLPPNKGIGYDSSYRTSEPTIIATLPIGYADGLPKTLRNSGEVLIHGQRCPIVGGISSAMATVDVTAVGAVNRGDEVVIIGTQGEAETTPDQLAKAANTGHLAVQTAITAPRMYMFSR